MSLPVYLPARVMWEAHPVVAAALADGTLIVRDEHVVPPFAVEVARVHYQSLAKAIKNEFREAEEIDPPEAEEESPSAVEST
ncbi:MAG: hypothetical protein ABW061_02075 [Polyangiaceae bacterium]